MSLLPPTSKFAGVEKGPAIFLSVPEEESLLNLQKGGENA